MIVLSVLGLKVEVDGGGNVCFRGFSELTSRVVVRMKLRSKMGKVRWR